MYSQEQLKEMLTEYRQLPFETEWLEFKEAKLSYDFGKLGKYFSALSNEANLKRKHSAWLIFGINDKKPRKIVGTQFRLGKEALESLKNEIASQTNGITFQEIYEVFFPEGRVLMFQIPRAPAGIPTSWKGHYYGRHGESLSALSMQELETIRQQGEINDWTAKICPNATIAHLDEEALIVAREKFKKKYQTSRFVDEIDGWDTVTFLEKAKLTLNGKITRAAILLLGKPEAYAHLSPHMVQITWKLSTEEEAYEHFGPPFLLTVEDLFRKIRNIKFRFHPFNKLIPIELEKYDVRIIQEALHNCIAHQDYKQNARIIVVEKVDRLTFQNIGGFFDGTVEDYVLKERTPELYRNPFLVQAMLNLDMIDTMGVGIRRMFISQRNRYFPLPEYDYDDKNHFILTIHGKLIDENYSRVLIEKEDLTLAEVMVLDRIQKKKPVDKEAVQLLRKKKLVEGRFPNLFVSAKIADLTASKATYVKNKAFDNEHYEKMILQFIRKFGSAGRQDIDDLILDKLPDVLSFVQKRKKVGNLLGKMRNKGLIKNIGATKKPQWVIQ